VHYAELRDGQSAISMGYRNGRVHLWRESWWDGETGIFIAYDDAGEYEFAVKEWDQRNRDGTTIRRRTVYEPGVLSRWKQEGSGWAPYATDTEPDTVPLLRRDGQTPMPIPVVHFPNGSGVADSVYGVSEVASLLALQDDINATQFDISAAAMLTAFQRLFLSGASDPKSVKLAPGSLFGDPSKDARLQVVESGDLKPLMDVHHFKRESMSVTSRTPVHTLTGDWPSGAALLRAEMPLIEKIEGMADVNGPQWTMVAHRAMELANAYSSGTEMDENVPITSVFAPAERIDELTELEIQRARAEAWDILSRLPKAAMIQAGVDEDVAEEIVSQREADLIGLGDIASGE
jgi:NADH:ubiquinone oxidoreductase subunit